MGSDFLSPKASANPVFATTHWSVVLLAGGASGSPEAEEALSRLCQTYWYPVYAFFRREGRPAEESKDFTQAFFAALLRRNDLARVQPARGRFRSFLLASARNFLLNEHDRATRLKRGGGTEILSIDGLTAEQWYELEPVDVASPEKDFDRRWAETLIEQALDRLKADYEASGQGARFEVLRDFVLGEAPDMTYPEAGARLKLSESAVTSAIHRMRVRFRDQLLREVADTVDNPADAESELRELLEALRA